MRLEAIVVDVSEKLYFYVRKIIFFSIFFEAPFIMRVGLVVSEGENVMSSSKFDKIVQIL